MLDLDMDITQWFTDQSHTMRAGQLVKIPDIGLLEIMNALQINDLQMDTGMCGVKARHFDPMAPLSTEDICWIMDEMVALEFEWWRGGTLCQTVHTSLAFHGFDHLAMHPDPLVSVVLRGFTIAYAKSIDLAYTELLKGNVSDGEDCWLDHYGISVHMSDPFEYVAEVLCQASTYVRNELDEVWEQELGDRLEMRLRLLSFLHSRQHAPVVHRVGTFEPSPTARTYFANVSSCLRQCMPLPPSPIIKHDWDAVAQVFHDLDGISALQEEVDWRLSLLGRSYSRQMLAITRSLYKSTLSPPRGVKGIDTDLFLRSWLARHTTSQPDVLDTLYMAVPQSGRRQFTVWRDLLHGYLINALSVPLQNRPRQRRTYLSLSFAWYERAILADEFSQYHPSFASIATCLFAARLDCLLEAALCAWDLDLVGPDEERLAWWWVYQVTSSRVQMALAESWESMWSRAWSNIAAGMIALVPFKPVSREVFDLRFKWALRVPSLGGEKRPSGLAPSFAEYMESDSPTDDAESQRCFVRAVEELSVLEQHLRSRSLLDFARVVKDLREDLSCIKLGGTRQRWLPVAR